MRKLDKKLTYQLTLGQYRKFVKSYREHPGRWAFSLKNDWLK